MISRILAVTAVATTKAVSAAISSSKSSSSSSSSNTSSSSSSSSSSNTSSSSSSSSSSKASSSSSSSSSSKASSSSSSSSSSKASSSSSSSSSSNTSSSSSSSSSSNFLAAATAAAQAMKANATPSTQLTQQQTNATVSKQVTEKAATVAKDLSNTVTTVASIATSSYNLVSKAVSTAAQRAIEVKQNTSTSSPKQMQPSVSVKDFIKDLGAMQSNKNVNNLFAKAPVYSTMKPNYGASAAAVALQSLNSIDPNNIQQSIQVRQTSIVVNPVMAAALSSSTISVHKSIYSNEYRISQLNSADRERLERFKNTTDEEPYSDEQKESIFLEMHTNQKLTPQFLDRIGVDSSKERIAAIEISYNSSIDEQGLSSIELTAQNQRLSQVGSLPFAADFFYNLGRASSYMPNNPEVGFKPIESNITNQTSSKGVNKSVFDKGKDVLENFNIDSAYVKPKHLSTTGGSGQKFLGNSKVDAEAILKDAIKNGTVKSVSDNGLTKAGNASYEIIIDTGKTIGTRGETLVKIVLSEDGGMLSAYPIK